jgi:VanZ family protein
MCLIYFFSSIPGNELGPDVPILNLIKKIGHFVIFGILAILYFTTFEGKKTLADTGSAVFLLSLLLTVLYAVGDEYHQLFTPGRHSSGYDVMIDASGALTVLGLLYIMKTRTKQTTARVNKME